MALVELPVPNQATRKPGDVRAFLREAERRIRRFQRRRHLPGFVAGDYGQAYDVLVAVADLAPGALFCEWGSGFGVIACLASWLDFDAHGIEAEGELVAAADQLAEDFALPTEFVHGSYVPSCETARIDAADYAWLATDAVDAHAALDLAPHDFGVIFAYPWPDEEMLTEELFERHAGAEALLVTYHGGDEFRLRRKI